MGETEVVPAEGLKPSEFVEFALGRLKMYDGTIVFKKYVAGRTIVLRISSGGYMGPTAVLEMRQGTSRYAEPGGELKDITAAAGCELYAWLDSHEACDTMQKALVSPNGQALALCALFRLLSEQARLRPDIREVKEPIKEIEQA